MARKRRKVKAKKANPSQPKTKTRSFVAKNMGASGSGAQR